MNNEEIEEIIKELQLLLQQIRDTRKKIEQALQPYTYNPS
jgi:hypothetical protein